MVETSQQAAESNTELSSQGRQEIRFAVVMYGGVSLCIYIHGVAQELLRLVRATSGADLSQDQPVDRVTQIYQKLSQQIRAIEPRHSEDAQKNTTDEVRVPTRFIVDILSGTSAGGINAVFLAKALAIRSQNLDLLRDTWMDKADMEKLLNNKSGPFAPKLSLLRGDWMYEQLFAAFSGMNSATCDSIDNYQQAEQIDLFATTTDLNGVELPILLSDEAVSERIHKGCFHFRFDGLAVPPIEANPICNAPAPERIGRNDFTGEFDAMLAFASRATSSFPAAFPPMKLSDIAPAVGKDEYPRLRDKYREFFRWVPVNEAESKKIAPKTESTKYPAKCRPIAFDDRELADGGYLDNKPFSYVVNSLKFRPTILPHTRKLLYVDPFPENLDDCDPPHIDFLNNAKSAAYDLPRYETIREEIERIKLSNRTQNRLNDLRKNVDASSGKEPSGELRPLFADSRLGQTVGGMPFSQSELKELIKAHGPGYGTYHVIRVADTTDQLAHMIAKIHGYVEDEDLFLALRYLARHWREINYAPNREQGKELESLFLERFDFSFRLRRLAALMEFVAQSAESPLSKKEIGKTLAGQMTRLLRTCDRLSQMQDNPLLANLDNKIVKPGWEDLKKIIKPAAEDDRRAAAQLFYESTPNFGALVDELAAKIRSMWEAVICHNREELRGLRTKYSKLQICYQNFDLRDMLSLTFLEGSDINEHTQTEIYRVSPTDGLSPQGGKKLAGYALMDFGAFLSREWRENDLLWGRLDGCARIVAAVLPHDADDSLRQKYIRELRIEIVEQEFSRRKLSDAYRQVARDAVALDRADPLSSEVEAFLKNAYAVPPGPEPKQSIRWLAQATTILGHMFEDDIGIRNSTTKFLQTAGAVVTWTIGFLVPRSPGSLFLNYWMTMLFFLCLTISLVSYLFGVPNYPKAGLEGAGLVLAVRFATLWIGWSFLLRTPYSRWLRWLIALPLATVLLLGCWRLPAAWGWVLAHIHIALQNLGN